MEIDDLLASAPDEVTRLNAQSISKPYRWFLVANNSAGDAWGIYQHDGKKILALWQFGGVHFCSCSAQARPCRHVLALKVICLQHPELVVKRECSPEIVKLIKKGAKN